MFLFAAVSAHGVSRVEVVRCDLKHCSTGFISEVLLSFCVCLFLVVLVREKEVVSVISQGVVSVISQGGSECDLTRR